MLICGTTASAQVPQMSSYPAAQATIFIDFDGQYVSGSVWNWSGPIDAQPATLTTAGMTEIFNRVAEDYRPFNVNITTDSTYYWNAPANRRIRIIVTPTSSWYGAAGGVSYVGSFVWGDNTPGWVFSTLLGNNIKYVAEAISHEAGHTLGLQHQSTFDASCIKTAEYNRGTGSGEIGWAPIMGVGYYENVTTWSIGPNTIGCSYIQNDVDIISTYNGFGLRADDVGNDISTAADINIYADTFNVSGLVNTAADVDAFRLVLPNPTNFRLTAIPLNVGSGNEGANVDIKVTLMNGTDTIGKYNPSTLLNAGIDTNLVAGTYYLVVDGVGNMYHSDFGSLGTYALTGTLFSVLALHHFNLDGNTSNGKHQLSWVYSSDEQLKEWVVEKSTDGKNFSALTNLPANTSSFSYKPFSNEVMYYRVKAICQNGGTVYYSNTIELKNKASNSEVLINTNTGNSFITVSSTGNFDYALYTAGGQLTGQGKLRPGQNQLSCGAAKGLLFLRYSNGNNAVTEKFIKQ